MTIILDLDYTLLDTERFKEALASVFADCGITGERFYQSYQQVAEHDLPAYDYDLDRHIDLLAGEMKCSPEELRTQVGELLKRTADFLYPGAEKFVADLRQLGFRIILLTLGNVGWQKMKVDNSGLAKLFNERIRVRSDKAAALADLADTEPPVFVINDNCNEVQAMKARQPSFHYIVKRGPKGTLENMEVPILGTFDEILEKIQQQTT